MYPSTMFPSGLHMFWTYPFKSFVAHSMGYIQQKCTSPHMLSLSIKWITRRVIKSKKLRGNILLKRHNVIIILTFKTWYVDGSYTFSAYELQNFTNPQDGYLRFLNHYVPHTNWKRI